MIEVTILVVAIIGVMVLGSDWVFNRSLTMPGEQIAANVTVTIQGSAELGDPITGVAVAAAANTQYAIAIDVSQATCGLILATEDMTIYVNDASTGAPTATIALTADEPVTWTTQADHPFGATDVTKIYVTAATAGALTIRVGYADATP